MQKNLFSSILVSFRWDLLFSFHLKISLQVDLFRKILNFSSIIFRGDRKKFIMFNFFFKFIDL